MDQPVRLHSGAVPQHGKDVPLDFQLVRIRQLVAARRENLDAVVAVRIVRSRDHHPRREVSRGGEIGHSGSGNNSRRNGLDSGLLQSGCHGFPNPAAGLPRVFTDHHSRADAPPPGGALRTEILPQTSSGKKNSGGVQGRLSGHSANAVGAKQSLLHASGNLWAVVQDERIHFSETRPPLHWRTRQQSAPR